MHIKRLFQISLAFLFALGLSFQVVHAEDESSEKYLLTYKFQMGEILRYEVDHSTRIKSTIEGTTQEAESKSESVKAWKVTDVLPNGEIEFVHLVEKVRMTNRVPNRAVRKFDSEHDKTPPPGFEQAAGAVGIPLTVVRINPAGKIVEREEKYPQPESYEDVPLTLQLSDEPLAIGDKWDFTYNVEVEKKNGGKQSIRTRRVCTLKKVEAGVATIKVEYQALTPLTPFIESQLVERLTKGTIRFDIDQGRVLSQKYDADRRVIGFSGDASSMHYVSRTEERLLESEQRVASKQK